MLTVGQVEHTLDPLHAQWVTYQGKIQTNKF